MSLCRPQGGLHGGLPPHDRTNQVLVCTEATHKLTCPQLNVSAIGQTVSIGSNDDSEPESTLDRILDKIPDRITDRINDEVNERIGEVAERIGIEVSPSNLNYQPPTNILSGLVLHAYDELLRRPIHSR